MTSVRRLMRLASQIDSQLVTAVEADDLEHLDSLLSVVGNKQTKSAALTHAVRCCQHRSVEALLAAGADPVFQFDGKSAVYWAIVQNDAVSLKLLVQGGASDHAAGQLVGQNDVRRSWHEEQRAVDEALFISCTLVSVESVELLLQLGANPNCCFYYDDEFLLSCSPLAAACHAPLRKQAPADAVCRAETIVQLLVDAGANVMRRCSTGETALHWAAEAGLCTSVAVLVAAGADLEKQAAISRRTPLMAAIYRNSPNCADIVGALIALGADVNSIYSTDFTPLCYAIDAQNKDVVELLLQNGACVDGLGGCSRLTMTTPLYLAMSVGDREMCLLLVRWGANINKRVSLSEARCNAFRVALLVNNFDLVRIFLASGADRQVATRLVTESIDEIFGSFPRDMVSLLPVSSRARLDSLQLLLEELLQPQKLKDLCRLVIRQYVKSYTSVEKLPLPTALVSFLLYNDF